MRHRLTSVQTLKAIAEAPTGMKKRIVTWPYLVQIISLLEFVQSTQYHHLTWSKQNNAIPWPYVVKAEPSYYLADIHITSPNVVFWHNPVKTILHASWFFPIITIISNLNQAAFTGISKGTENENGQECHPIKSDHHKQDHPAKTMLPPHSHPHQRRCLQDIKN